MSKDLSRRDFLKGAAAGIAGVAAMGVLGACENKESTPSAAPENKGLYTPGTYSATATGMAEITVTMTFDANSITDVQLDLSGETENIGQAKGEDLKKALLDAQSADIDAIAGATITSEAVRRRPPPVSPRPRARAWRSPWWIPPPQAPVSRVTPVPATGWAKPPV